MQLWWFHTLTMTLLTRLDDAYLPTLSLYYLVLVGGTEPADGISTVTPPMTDLLLI